MFKPGDKVVCVDSGNFGVYMSGTVTPYMPLAGPDIYCVTSVFIEPTFDASTSRIGLQGFSQGHYAFGHEVGFAAKRFRLVHRCKDSVSASVSNEVQA